MNKLYNFIYLLTNNIFSLLIVFDSKSDYEKNDFLILQKRQIVSTRNIHSDICSQVIRPPNIYVDILFQFKYFQTWFSCIKLAI